MFDPEKRKTLPRLGDPRRVTAVNSAPSYDDEQITRWLDENEQDNQENLEATFNVIGSLPPRAD